MSPEKKRQVPALPELSTKVTGKTTRLRCPQRYRRHEKTRGEQLPFVCARTDKPRTGIEGVTSRQTEQTLGFGKKRCEFAPGDRPGPIGDCRTGFQILGAQAHGAAGPEVARPAQLAQSRQITGAQRKTDALDLVQCLDRGVGYRAPTLDQEHLYAQAGELERERDARRTGAHHDDVGGKPRAIRQTRRIDGLHGAACVPSRCGSRPLRAMRAKISIAGRGLRARLPGSRAARPKCAVNPRAHS